MFWIKFTAFSLLAVQIQVICDEGICTKREIIERQVRRSFMKTYVETYKKSGCLFRCKRTRYKSYREYRNIPEISSRIVKECCSGYIRRSSENDTNIECSPICLPECKNGICTKPGKCECNQGYIVSPNNTHYCTPTCNPSCNHGKCVAPNTCECDFGYILRDNQCQPVCTEVCNNGTCVAPETCKCYPGFKMSDVNVCNPYCARGCINGTCVSPEVCICDEGWQKTAPNTCKPKCVPPCGNGVCIQPNQCRCDEGYEMSENVTSSVCIPNCPNCEGTCTAPGVCTCYAPYDAKHMSGNGSKCDCFYNCTETEVKCDRTVCVLNNISTIASIPTIDRIATDRSTSINSSNYTIIINQAITEGNDNVTTNDENIWNTTKKALVPSSNSGNVNINFDDDSDYALLNVTFDEILTNAVNATASTLLTSDETSIPVWIYYVVSVMIMFIVTVLIILILKRTSLVKHFKGGSYVVKDDKYEKEVASLKNMRFSSIIQKKSQEDKL